MGRQRMPALQLDKLTKRPPCPQRARNTGADPSTRTRHFGLDLYLLHSRRALDVYPARRDFFAQRFSRQADPPMR
jgi:hypothetical protein